MEEEEQGEGEINQDYFNQVEAENQQLKVEKMQAQGALASTSFGGGEDNESLTQYRLTTDDVLDRIEHFLKGDIAYTSPEGEFSYKTQTNQELVLLNEFGISAIMGILSNYIHRGTSLSFYDEERIYEICGDLGDKLAQYIYCNYEKMGMDTLFKRSRYHLIVINILHLVESTYRKALQGREAEEIGKHTIVTQSQNVGMMPSKQTPMPKARFNLLRPKTW